MFEGTYVAKLERKKSSQSIQLGFKFLNYSSPLSFVPGIWNKDLIVISREGQTWPYKENKFLNSC